MQLLTKELEETFAKNPFGSQEGLGTKAQVLVKYFNPYGRGTWIITEAEKEDDDWVLFGLMHIFEWEWGYVSLRELQNAEIMPGLGIERALFLPPRATVEDVQD